MNDFDEYLHTLTDLLILIKTESTDEYILDQADNLSNRLKAILSTMLLDIAESEAKPTENIYSPDLEEFPKIAEEIIQLGKEFIL